MDAARLQLPPVIDVSTAGALKTALVEALGGDMVLDGSAVQRVGGLGVQLLLSAERACQAAGGAFSLLDPSPALSEAVRLIGAQSLGAER